MRAVGVGPMFYEEHPDRYETITHTVTESPYRIAHADIERDLDAALADPDGVHGP